MSSLDLTADAGHGAAAIPGEVRRWRAFWLLAVAFLMTVIDLAIVNVALPTIGRKLHFPESDLQWVVTAYGLTFGGFLMLAFGFAPREEIELGQTRRKTGNRKTKRTRKSNAEYQRDYRERQKAKLMVVK